MQMLSLRAVRQHEEWAEEQQHASHYHAWQQEKGKAFGTHKDLVLHVCMAGLLHVAAMPEPGTPFAGAA